MCDETLLVAERLSAITGWAEDSGQWAGGTQYRQFWRG
jgi:hypothetical protein